MKESSEELLTKARDEMNFATLVTMILNFIAFIIGIFVFKNMWNVGIVYISHFPKIDYGQAGSILTAFWVLSKILAHVFISTAEKVINRWFVRVERVTKILSGQ